VVFLDEELILETEVFALGNFAAPDSDCHLEKSVMSLSAGQTTSFRRRPISRERFRLILLGQKVHQINFRICHFMKGGVSLIGRIIAL